MVPFAEYRPDLPPLDGFAQVARNVVPGPMSYRPFRSVVTKSNALDARVQGAFASSDTTENFAGTADELAELWPDELADKKPKKPKKNGKG